MGGRRRQIRKLLRNFNAVRNWQLLLVLIPLLFVAATLLRLDHLRMVELRAEVLAADATDEDELINQSLIRLQEFVFTHIVVNVVESNGIQRITFGTGPFYMEHQYLRAANTAIMEAENNLSSDANPNGNIYAAVSSICRPQAIANGWVWNSPGYLECWTSELAKYPAAGELNTTLTANVPSTELFRHDYASPIWAPTWSGWIILICLVLAVVILTRVIIWGVLQLSLLFMKKNA